MEAEKRKLSHGYFGDSEPFLVQPAIQGDEPPGNELLIGNPQSKIDDQHQRGDRRDLEEIRRPHPGLRIQGGKEKGQELEGGEEQQEIKIGDESMPLDEIDLNPFLKERVSPHPYPLHPEGS